MPSGSDLIAELKAWCDAERGRGSWLAEHLGVSRFVVSKWLAGKRTPNFDHGLKIQEFLKKQRRRKTIDADAVAKDMEFK
jgi:hypothetical protein